MVKKTSAVVNTTGKRKTSVARVSVVKGNGNVEVNSQKFEVYFKNEFVRLRIREPLIISEMADKLDVSVNVSGGGFNSQADAIRQAIARAIVEMTGSEDLKELFLSYDRALIVSDTRFKEMKKPNDSAARASRQKSYR